MTTTCKDCVVDFNTPPPEGLAKNRNLGLVVAGVIGIESANNNVCNLIDVFFVSSSNLTKIWKYVILLIRGRCLTSQCNLRPICHTGAAKNLPPIRSSHDESGGKCD